MRVNLEIFRNYKDEFNWLQAYYEELRRSNPRTRVQLDIHRHALQEGRKVLSI